LSVDEGYDGKPLVHCKAGCQQQSVIEALRARGLWSHNKDHTRSMKMSERERQRERENEEFKQLRDGWTIAFAVAREHRRNPQSGLSKIKNYLAGRGISIMPPGAMYATAGLMRGLTSIGYPAVALPVVNNTDAPLQGVQLTYVTEDGQNIQGKDGKNKRLTYGIKKGGYCVLVPPRPDEPCILGEGSEKALAAAQIAGVAALALLGKPEPETVATMMPACSEVIVSADNSPDGLDWGKAVARCSARPGRDARLCHAPENFKDWDDWLVETNPTPSELDEQRRVILSGRRFRDSGSREVMSVGMRQFLDIQFPPQQLLFSPWLPIPGLAMIDGKTGEGKTFLALSIAYAAAQGRDLLDWKAGRPARVLYVEGELPGAMVQKRMRLLGDPLPDEMFRILSLSQFVEMAGRSMINLALPADRDLLDAEIEDHGSELIILDSKLTLVRFTGDKSSGANSDKIESWQPLQDWLLKHRARGRTVIIVHHHGKSGSQLGSIGHEITLDTRITIHKDRNLSTDDESAFKLEVGKGREIFGVDEKPMIAFLSTTTGVITWRREGVQASSRERVKELLAAGKKQSEIAKELGLSKSHVSNLAKELNESITGADDDILTGTDR
jgi:putative DNA primase/helicase